MAYDPIAGTMTDAATSSPAADDTTQADTSRPGLLERSWSTLKEAAAHVARDLTPTLAMPGSGPSGAAFSSSPPPPGPSGGYDPLAGTSAASAPAASPDNLPVHAPFMWGIARGVKDVTDTGHRILTDVTGGDKAKLRADQQQAEKDYQAEYGDSWTAGAGRIAGQTLATAPVLGPAGTVLRGAVPALATPAATWLGRGLQLGTEGAAAGAGAAGLTGQDPVTGAATGAVAGPVIGGLTKAVDVLRGFAGGVRPGIAALADRARELGMNVPVSSMSTNPFMRIVADAGKTLPFSGADASALANQRALQGVVARQMGSTADTFGPAEMRVTRDQIRTGYNAALAQVPPIPGGTPLATDLSNIGADATRFLDPDTVGHVGRAIQEAAGAWQRGPITADAYRALTASDGPLARIADAAPGAAQPYISQVRDAVRARMLSAAPPGVADDLRALDQQYRAMKTIQPLAEKSTTGDISPAGILERMRAQSSKYDSSNQGLAYTGGGTLGDVGRIGKQFFGHIPESGTAPRQQTYEFAKNPIATTLAAIPSLAGNRWLQSWLRSPTVSGRVIDTSLGGAVPNTGRALPYGLLGPIDYESNRAP